MNAGLILKICTAGLVLTAASAQYSTSFEAPTFSSGTIAGQDSWTSTTPDRAQVLTGSEIATELTAMSITPGTTVRSGSQALFVSGAGSSSATIRQISGLQSENLVALDLWARPLTGANQGNVFLTLEDSAGDRAAAFRFGFVNSQTTIDYGTTVAGIWQTTGLEWNPDTWYHFTIEADYSSKSYDFSIDGSQINTEPIPFYNAASDEFSQVRIFRGSNQAGMIVDDLAVTAIPEPGAITLLLLGAAALFFPRRRR